ncbi:MAG: hypothetical protein RQ757_06930 [Pseudomonadales bacterium]|nr:hypothetical protein [Pseudomonadales bacterium]
MKNIDLFNEFAARVMADLYEAFPKRVPIDFVALSGSAGVDEYGYPGPKCEICSETVGWLISQGYVEATDIDLYTASQARLTEKGYTTLSAVPSALKTKDAAGAQIVRMLKAGAKVAAIETLKNVFRWC